MEDASRVVLDGRPLFSPHGARSPTILFLSHFHIVPPLCLVKSISHSHPSASCIAAETKPAGCAAAQHPQPRTAQGSGPSCEQQALGQGVSISPHVLHGSPSGAGLMDSPLVFLQL